MKIKESVQVDWSTRITAKVEPPSEKIYEFTGCLVLDTEAIPLKINNLLLRGSRLRNTEWVVGLVVYTGQETRIMKNSSSTTPLKRARLDRHVNRNMMIMFGVLFAMVLISFSIWAGSILIGSGRHREYLKWVTWSEFQPSALVMRFFTYVVLYHSIVPISLLVTMEICRFHLARLINSDLEFFVPAADDEEEPEEGAKVANSNIIDDLGQVKYVLSDKTGTLTRNLMTLEQISDKHGTVYDVSSNLNASCLPHDLMEAMAVCHTVMIEGTSRSSLSDIRLTSSTANIQYQASSPDELAIVKGCSLNGFRFIERQVGGLVLKVSEDIRRFEVLHCVEFSSERKRMTLVARISEQVYVFCKGADDIIFSRLSKSENTGPLQSTIESFAKSGLRTLCFSRKKISNDEWSAWCNRYMENPKLMVSEGIDKLERNLELLGATAVEDRLASDVPETIISLQEAGIKVWILTGDRIETAMNIGVACRLLSESKKQITLTGIEAIGQLKTLLKGVASSIKTSEEYALIVDGNALDSILSSTDTTEDFIDLAMLCTSVICCRTSPLQKRMLTENVQRKSGAICLAIGDGANDVGMIQAANIGIGIAGREGRQAARSSDIAITSFRFLNRLLLVHGSWSYVRMAKTIVYCAYKNMVFVSSQFWFAMVCAASGQTVFETWMLTLSNALFTSWVPIVIGVTDQHITAEFLLKHPGLYKRGQRNSVFTPRRFWTAVLNGSLQSLAIFILTSLAIGGDPVLPNGSSGGLWVLSSTYYCSALLAILYSAAMNANAWNVFTIGILLFGIISWFGYVLSADMLLARLFLTESGFLYGITRPLFHYPPFWFITLITPPLVLARDFLWKFAKRAYMPREYHIVQEMEMLARKSKAPSGLSRPFSAVSIGSVQHDTFNKLMQEQPVTHDGFAFAQASGQATLLKQ